MALTSVELIDVLRQAACGIESGRSIQQLSLPVEQIISELKKSGIKAQGLELVENIRNSGSGTAVAGVANHLRSWADALEKQLLAMLDLPVDISYLRNAA